MEDKDKEDDSSSPTEPATLTKTDPTATTAVLEDIKEMKDEVSKRATTVQALPGSSEKKAAGEMLLEAAKKLDGADKAVSKVIKIDEEKRATINDAKDVKNLPEGDMKEEKKEELLEKAAAVDDKMKDAVTEEADAIAEAEAATKDAVEAVEDAKAAPAPAPKEEKSSEEEEYGYYGGYEGYGDDTSSSGSDADAEAYYGYGGDKVSAKKKRAH